MDPENAALLEPTGNLQKEFDANCATLEGLSPVLLDLLAGKSDAGECGLLGDLRQRFN